jgi:phosphopantothenoylcysteine decarboxylase/phosphopantothenate--cysteine ligase
MRDAVVKETRLCEALIMAAAVADYQPKIASTQKIKKENTDNLTIELIKTPDILSEVSDGNFIKVGFAAESEHLLENARAKIVRKQLDLLVANDITRNDSGFGTDTNKVWLVGSGTRGIQELPLLTKREVAEKILDNVVALLKSKESKTGTTGEV